MNVASFIADVSSAEHTRVPRAHLLEAVLDLTMPYPDAIEAARQLKRAAASRSSCYSLRVKTRTTCAPPYAGGTACFVKARLASDPLPAIRTARRSPFYWPTGCLDVAKLTSPDPPDKPTP